MKISVKNLGPIKSGTVNLDERFTVFVGYNNSGKTYMANVIWSFYHHYFTTRFNVENNESLDQIIKNNYTGKKELNIEKLDKQFKEFLDSIRDKVIDDHHVKLDHPSFKGFKLAFDSYDNYIEKSMDSCWSIRWNERFFVENEGIPSQSFKALKNKNEKFYDIKSNIDCFCNNEGLNPKRRLGNIREGHHPEDIAPFPYMVNQFLKELATPTLYPYFLPANRIFYPSYYRYIFLAKKEESDVIEKRLRTGNGKNLQGIINRPYHKYVDDLLDSLSRSGLLTPNNSYDDIIKELEKLINGKVSLKNTEGFPLITLQLNTKEEIDMHLASSSTNQLTLFYLYLKHFCLGSNDLLIIDEPEENLHPNHQAALAKLLVKFANRNNNKVIVTTHSSFFTDCINNYIRLAHIRNEGVELPEDIQEEMLSGMDDYSLKGEDFGVYFFDGERIKQYKTQKYGVYFEDFVKAEIKMKDMTDRLNGIIYENEFSHV